MSTLKENGKVVCCGPSADNGKKCTDMGPDHKRCIVCRQRERYTPEEWAERERRADLMMSVVRAAHEHAKVNGIGKGRGGSGSLPCPACGGTVRYAVASCNGHMRGVCSTRGCASWME